MTTEVLRYRSICTSLGDPNAGLLRYEAGTVLWSAGTQHDGWIFASKHRDGTTSGGWCPAAYLEQQQETEVCNAPSLDGTVSEEEDCTPSKNAQNNSTWGLGDGNGRDPVNNVPATTTTAISELYTAQNAGGIIARGFCDAGTVFQGVATEAQYRIDDMREQQRLRLNELAGGGDAIAKALCDAGAAVHYAATEAQYRIDDMAGQNLPALKQLSASNE